MQGKPMNPVLERIDLRRKELDMSREAVAQAAGLSRDGVRNLARDPAAIPRGSTINKLAAVLRVSPTWLLTGVGERGSDPPSTAPVVVPPPSEPSATAASRAFAQDVPVLGTAAGAIIGNDVEGFDIQGTIEYIRRPPGLTTARDLYTIYVTGESMFPRFLPGELVFVHPHREPRVGDFVIVQTKQHETDPGQAYIKRLARRSGGVVTLEQFNPVATIKISMQFVTSIHRVLTTNELFGV